MGILAAATSDVYSEHKKLLNHILDKYWGSLQEALTGQDIITTGFVLKEVFSIFDQFFGDELRVTLSRFKSGTSVPYAKELKTPLRKVKSYQLDAQSSPVKEICELLKSHLQIYAEKLNKTLAREVKEEDVFALLQLYFVKEGNPIYKRAHTSTLCNDRQVETAVQTWQKDPNRSWQNTSSHSQSVEKAARYLRPPILGGLFSSVSQSKQVKGSENLAVKGEVHSTPKSHITSANANNTASSSEFASPTVTRDNLYTQQTGTLDNTSETSIVNLGQIQPEANLNTDFTAPGGTSPTPPSVEVQTNLGESPEHFFPELTGDSALHDVPDLHDPSGIENNLLSGYLLESDIMISVEPADIELFGHVANPTRKNYTPSIWGPGTKFESEETEQWPFKLGVPNEEMAKNWQNLEFPTAQLVGENKYKGPLKRTIDTLLTDVDKAMKICVNHNETHNDLLPSDKGTDQERADPKNIKFQLIKAFKNDYTQLSNAKMEMIKSINTLKPWLMFTSRAPLEQWLSSYVTIIDSTKEKMRQDLQTIDEQVPCEKPIGESDISTMMGNLNVSNNGGLNFKLKGLNTFETELPVFDGDALVYKSWRQEIDDLFLDKYFKDPANTPAPLIWNLLHKSLAKSITYDWKDTYDKTHEGITQILQKLEDKYNNPAHLRLVYKKAIQQIPSPRDGDVKSLERLSKNLERIEKGLFRFKSNIEYHKGELMMHLMPKISKYAPTLYSNWLSYRQIAMHQNDKDGNPKSNNGLELIDEYSEFKKFILDREREGLKLELEGEIRGIGDKHSARDNRKKRNNRNNRTFAGNVQAHGDENSLKRRGANDLEYDQTFLTNNKKRKPMNRNGKGNHKGKMKFGKGQKKKSFATDARNFLGNKKTPKGQFIKSCPFHKGMNFSGHSPAECRNLNENHFKNKELVWAILHRNRWCIGCLKRHPGTCNNPKPCGELDNGKKCPHVHHPKLHFAQSKYLNAKKYKEQEKILNARIDGHFNSNDFNSK